MYSRTSGCPFVTLAKRVLADHAQAYEEIFIDANDDARARVLRWTGFLSVPTLVLAADDGVLPPEEPAPLPEGSSPRGIDRGWMITEPNSDELEAWLLRHGLIEATTAE
jgi:glutaredoxin